MGFMHLAIQLVDSPDAGASRVDPPGFPPGKMSENGAQERHRKEVQRLKEGEERVYIDRLAYSCASSS
jgi:hypothetical protein